MNVFILGNMADLQTGPYISESFKQLGHVVAVLDSRMAVKVLGNKKGQEHIVKEIENIKFNPDLILVMKGLELTHATLKKIKELQPKAKLVNWFFDKYLSTKPIWEEKDYFDTLRLFDFYICSLKGVADKLNEAGFSNARYVDEACFPEAHGKAQINFFQEEKYGEDISFCGSIGLFEQHPKRIPILNRLVDDGFNMKIWGGVACDWKYIPSELRRFHQDKSVINENHSKVVQSSLINIGIDQDVDLDMGHSARVYRVLCAGGLYLCNATKGLDKMFNINKEGEKITEDQDLVVFYNEDDLIEKCDFLLEYDKIREKIAKNGMKKVLESHTFKDRIKEIVSMCGENNDKQEQIS